MIFLSITRQYVSIISKLDSGKTMKDLNKTKVQTIRSRSQQLYTLHHIIKFRVSMVKILNFTSISIFNDTISYELNERISRKDKNTYKLTLVQIH